MTEPSASTAPRAVVPAGRWVVGASALHAEVHDAEHLLADLVETLNGLGLADATLVACTHLVAAPWRHEAVSVEVAVTGTDAARTAALLGAYEGRPVGLATLGAPTASTGPEHAVAGALAAAHAHARRTGGRAVVFPGQDALLGEVPVAEVPARSAIEVVASLSGPVDADAVLDTRGFVRPDYVDGRLTLRCLHDDPARLVPWEPAVVHRCGGH